DKLVTGVQTCALPICLPNACSAAAIGSRRSPRKRNTRVVEVLIREERAVMTIGAVGLADEETEPRLFIRIECARAIVDSARELRSEERRVGKGRESRR